MRRSKKKNVSVTTGRTGLTLKGEVTIRLKEAGKGHATIEIIGSSMAHNPANLAVGDTLTVTVEL